MNELERENVDGFDWTPMLCKEEIENLIKPFDDRIIGVRKVTFCVDFTEKELWRIAEIFSKVKDLKLDTNRDWLLDKYKYGSLNTIGRIWNPDRVKCLVDRYSPLIKYSNSLDDPSLPFKFKEETENNIIICAIPCEAGIYDEKEEKVKLKRGYASRFLTLESPHTDPRLFGLTLSDIILLKRYYDKFVISSDKVLVN